MKKQTNATDETLVALYAQGNNEAFDILLNRYKDRLYAYIYYTVRNEELAEDIFQETFTKAIVTIQQGRYNENGKFPAWLTRIAHNLIIDCFRQEKQENEVCRAESADTVLLINMDIAVFIDADVCVEFCHDRSPPFLTARFPDPAHG